jgi:hypothetical protein
MGKLETNGFSATLRKALCSLEIAFTLGPSASTSRQSLHQIQAGPRWVASRLSAGKGGRLAPDGILADHNLLRQKNYRVTVTDSCSIRGDLECAATVGISGEF